MAQTRERHAIAVGSWYSKLEQVCTYSSSKTVREQSFAPYCLPPTPASLTTLARVPPGGRAIPTPGLPQHIHPGCDVSSFDRYGRRIHLPEASSPPMRAACLEIAVSPVVVVAEFKLLGQVLYVRISKSKGRKIATDEVKRTRHTRPHIQRYTQTQTQAHL